MSDSIIELLKDQFDTRIYVESIPRIIKVCELLSHEQIWYKHNEHSNSIGHLTLHLCGNVTQWIGSGVGSSPDIRHRSEEFSTTVFLPKEELFLKLHALKIITDSALDSLEEDSLHEIRKIQGFNESVLGIIIHVIEHFSYHTGQIAMIGKFLENKDLKFYEGLDLDVTS